MAIPKDSSHIPLIQQIPPIQTMRLIILFLGSASGLQACYRSSSQGLGIFT